MEEEFDDGWRSRSSKKRESTALQKRGEELAALSPAVWKQLPVPEDLLEALHENKKMKNHEARRRYMQYIGRLMREMDDDARDRLFAGLDLLQGDSREARDLQHRLEALRDSLLAVDEQERENAFTTTLADFPGATEARLRHLVDASLADKEKGRPPKHARELFRYLRETILPVSR